MTRDGGACGLRPGRHLGSLAWPAVDRRTEGGPVLAVPLGATEQHGPHLPLSTDTDVAQALCTRLAAARDDVLVGPALAYGASGEHQAFPGTLSIGHAALEAVLVELCRSASHGMAGVVIVCAHGGNATSLARAVRLLTGEGRRVLGWTATWTGDAHAGRTETSLMLSIAPATVDLARAEAGTTAPLGELLPALRAGALRDVAPNGVLGDPSGASGTEGEALLDRMAGTLVGAVGTWRAGWARPPQPATARACTAAPDTESAAGR